MKFIAWVLVTFIFLAVLQWNYGYTSTSGQQQIESSSLSLDAKKTVNASNAPNTADRYGSDIDHLHAPRCAAGLVFENGWSSHDGCILGSDMNNQQNKCRWATTKASADSPRGTAPQMCCRPYSSATDRVIIAQGIWQDCSPIISWWHHLQDRSEGRGKIYMDIGANIGSCLVMMMAERSVTSFVAFEPNPANQFYLWNSILAARRELSDKVKLYPVALGDEEKVSPIFEEAGNAGHSVVGHAYYDKRKRGYARGEVRVKRLDDIVLNQVTTPYIHFLKIDAEGYEVNILKGARKLLASGAINAAKFELATRWLRAQGTSSREYINTWLQYGYQIYYVKSMQLLSQSDLVARVCGASIEADYVAVRLEPGKTASQEQIVCERNPSKTT